jgi:hypothetical protein
MGAGHSGSTILGVALGNCSSFFYAGEVDEWLVNEGDAGWGGSERTRFWNAVRERVDMDAAASLFGGRTNRYVERSSALLRVDRWRARRRILPRYRSLAEELFRAIVDAAKATHVVDTSHFPLRARELRAAGGLELYLVLLVRDPQDVVASNLRQISPRQVAERRLRIVSTNVGLWLTHLLSLLVFLTHPRERRVFVRYEDFVTDPEDVLRQILDRVDPSVAVPDVKALRTGFPFEGNRLIGSEVIAVERPRAPNPHHSLFTALLQLPWSLALSRLRPAARAKRGRSSPG